VSLIPEREPYFTGPIIKSVTGEPPRREKKIEILDAEQKIIYWLEHGDAGLDSARIFTRLDGTRWEEVKGAGRQCLLNYSHTARHGVVSVSRHCEDRQVGDLLVSRRT